MSEGIGSRALQHAAPHLSRTIAPVWLATPYEVPTIDEALAFDTVILVDAGATTIAENLGAIRRARQVVAVGDPVTQTPTPFEIGMREAQQGLLSRPGSTQTGPVALVAVPPVADEDAIDLEDLVAGVNAAVRFKYMTLLTHELISAAEHPVALMRFL